MTQEFYERKSSTKIFRWRVVEEITKSDIEGDIAELGELLALSSGTKEQLANEAPELLGSNPDHLKTLVGNFDFTKRKKREKFQDILDYWNHDTLSASGINKIQSTWVNLFTLAQGSGAVIQNVCGEEGENPASFVIDGETSTHWSHIANEPHSIVIDFTYPKTINAIRIWIPTAGAVYQLSNVVIEGAKQIAGLSKPYSLLASGISFTGNTNWSEHVFSGGSARIRYLRLRNIDTDNSVNTVRIREIQVRSQIKFFTTEGD